MIIMFRGTDGHHNMAPQALALYAAINATKFNRRTLVIQLYSNFPVEKILRGKQDSEEQVSIGGGYNFDDTGIDSLMRRIETQRFSKEIIDVACKHMSKTDNLLDIAGVSKKDDFEREIILRQEVLKKLLQEAKKLYEDIYILANGKSGEQMKMLNTFVDLSIICVPQGSRDNVTEPFTIIKEAEEERTDGKDSKDTKKESKKAAKDRVRTLYMVTDFDRRSSFDVMRMRRAYGVKKIAVLPYNTGFKDAYNSESVLAYAIANTNVTENDANFEIIDAVMSVKKLVMDQGVPEEPEFDLNRLTVAKRNLETAESRTLTAKNIRYTKKYVGHLWWKREVDGYEVDPDSFDDETGETEDTASVESLDELDRMLDGEGDAENVFDEELITGDSEERLSETEEAEPDEVTPDEDLPDAAWDEDDWDEPDSEEIDEMIEAAAAPKKRGLFGRKK